MKWLALVVVVLSACSNKENAEAEKRARCEEGIARGVEMTLQRRLGRGPMANSPDAQALSADLGPKLKTTMLDLCTNDDWPDTVIECFKSSSDISKCKDGLKPEQRTHYTKGMMRVMLQTARPTLKPRAGSGSADAGSGSAGSGSAAPAGSAVPAGSGSAK